MATAEDTAAWERHGRRHKLLLGPRQGAVGGGGCYTPSARQQQHQQRPQHHHQPGRCFNRAAAPQADRSQFLGPCARASDGPRGAAGPDQETDDPTSTACSSRSVALSFCFTQQRLSVHDLLTVAPAPPPIAVSSVRDQRPSVPPPPTTEVTDEELVRMVTDVEMGNWHHTGRVAL